MAQREPTIASQLELATSRDRAVPSPLARARRALVALLLLLAELAMTVHARAETTTRAVLELQVNGTRYGDVIVLLSKDDVLISGDALARAGIVRMKSRPVQHLGGEYYSLRHSDPHLAFSVNEIDLMLEITAPATALGSATLDLAEPAPPGMWHPDEPSAYLTYAPSLADFSAFRLFAEAGGSVGPLRVTTSGSYQHQLRPVRLMSQAVYADRTSLREFVLGDSYVSTGPLGGSALLGGFGIFRNFQLDPYFVRIPRLGYRGSVMAPSTVDVYVNDVLVRRAAIAPGEFDLKGLAPASGAGNVRYVVRDPLSRQSDIVLDYYAASSALSPGLSEYAYAAGFERNSYGSRSFDYGKPLLAGFYRVGVTSHLTSGFRLEMSRTRVSGGTQVTFSSTLGEVDVASAVSIDREERRLSRGNAGQVGYYYQSGPASVRAVVKATSPRYSNTSLHPARDRDLVEQSTSVGLSIGPRTNLSALIGFAYARDAGPHARSSLTVNRQLTPTLFGQLILVRDDRALGFSEYEGFVTLSVLLPEHHSASVSGFTNGEHADATASLSKPIMGRTGIGYQGSATLGPNDRIAASVQAQNRYLRADASYFYDAQGSHTLIDASGSLVWLKDTGAFVSRPIYESFAVVEVPHTEGATAYLNNQAVGKTDESGLLLIPDLQAYYGNRLRVDASELPNDVEVDEGEVIVAPPAHAGAHLMFEARRLRAVRGKIDPVGVTLDELRYGELRVTARGQTFFSPIGHNGEFELEGMPSGVWPAEVRGETGYCSLLLPVPFEGKPIERLGKLRCAAPGVAP